MILGKMIVGAVGSVDLLSGLLSVWEFNETSGAIVYDAYGSVNGTRVSATLNQTGILDKCYQLDGSDDYISLPSGDTVKLNGSWTLSFWYKGISYNGRANPYVMTMHEGLSDSGYALFTQTDGKMWLRRNNKNFYMANAYTSLNNWSLITWSYDGSTLRGYMEGLEKTILGASPEVSFSTNTESQNLTIGKLSTWTLFGNFYIDQTAIWDRALSSREIRALYNNGSGLAYVNW